MENILGIVAEYNPFHNGHLYHLEKSKELLNADYSICIMSGNFTQRGNTSIVDKWAKTEMALSAGIDLVLELPTIYSISSAENFAYGSLKILDSLQIVNYVSFGSECGDISTLQKFANILYDEPKEYISLLTHELSKGLSYPRARENALLMYVNDIRKYANVLSNPNNILGIEYLKAIKKLNSSIVPYTIERNSISYHSVESNGKFASSTGIREMVRHEKDAKPFMPLEAYEILADRIKYGKIVPDISVFEKEILYTLRKMSVKEIENLPDVSEGLENSIKNASNECNTLSELIMRVKSKRYTQTRINRILLYALLNITKKDMKDLDKVTPYIRILGMNEKGKKLVSSISNKNPKLKLVTSVKDFIDSNNNKILKNMIDTDILATDIYTLGYDYEPCANLDYTKKLVIK
jgi:predicted nucleotidyltransferase